jgi:hypothetical protein
MKLQRFQKTLATPNFFFFEINCHVIILMNPARAEGANTFEVCLRYTRAPFISLHREQLQTNLVFHQETCTEPPQKG